MTIDPSRIDRFVWQPGDIEIRDGPAQPDPKFTFDPQTQELLDRAQSSMINKHLSQAYRNFLDGYYHWGGYRYHGFTHQSDGANYRGSAIWSEADIVLRLAHLLKAEFPESSDVHAEFPISKWSRSDYDKERDGRQRIDLAVSDLGYVTEGPDAQEQFGSLLHWLFLETKWMPKGWWGGRWEGLEADKTAKAIAADALRLSHHVNLRRCLVGAVFVVDDECLFEYLKADYHWPENVQVLVASPKALANNGHANDETVCKELERIERLSN